MFKFIIVVIFVIIFVVSWIQSSNNMREIITLRHINDSLKTEVSFLNLKNGKKVDEIVEKCSEYGFFEGQHCALVKDIRIIKDKDGYWHWAKNPNKDGTKPLFSPEWLGKDY